MRRVAAMGAVCAAIAMTVMIVTGCAPAEEPSVTAEVEAPTEPVAKGAPAEADAVLDPVALVGTWKLASLGGVPVAEGFDTTIEFTADGRLGGSAGCNNYMGEYTFDQGVLALPMAIAATKKMCPPPMMEQEDAFLRALAGFESAAVDGETLTLFVADKEEPLVFNRIVEEAGH